MQWIADLCSWASVKRTIFYPVPAAETQGSTAPKETAVRAFS
jgi:hypothetical protein